jgi:GNAT superfamily N-acetyltransferase
MADDVFIRPARSDEQAMLESLQRRASLSNPGDREVLLAHPDAIEFPIEEIVAGSVFVAERAGVVAGFAAIVPRPDGGAELDALFVELHLWKRSIGRRLVDHVADVARVRTATYDAATAVDHYASSNRIADSRNADSVQERQEENQLLVRGRALYRTHRQR